ncbi:MAG TPA: protein translocase subunit SecF [Thermoanaerobacterales bacterium]|nr:protein translocase subunit SecF [Thermoanaerobacterales bacterium]
MDFIGKRKLWFVLSGTVIVIGIIAILFTGMNMGIDFRGGTLLHYNIGQEFDISQVRNVLEELDLKDNEIKKAGDNKEEVIIRVRMLSQSEKNKILTSFQTVWPDIETIRMEEVDPIVGQELKEKALLATIIASLGMIIYITLRFEFKFAITAILAVLHDALIVLGFFALFKIPINAPFIAAILTILGYSINDTIVIYDRIRENIRLLHKETLDKIINISLKQTLTRSINTSLTTLLAIIMLYFFGGETIKDFTLALIIGIIAGTYSSIFIASPLWYTWKKTEHGV